MLHLGNVEPLAWQWLGRADKDGVGEHHHLIDWLDGGNMRAEFTRQYAGLPSIFSG